MLPKWIAVGVFLFSRREEFFHLCVQAKFIKMCTYLPCSQGMKLRALIELQADYESIEAKNNEQEREGEYPWRETHEDEQSLDN